MIVTEDILENNYHYLTLPVIYAYLFNFYFEIWPGMTLSRYKNCVEKNQASCCIWCHFKLNWLADRPEIASGYLLTMLFVDPKKM